MLAQAAFVDQTASVLPMDAAPVETVRAAVNSVFKHPQIAPLIAHDYREPGFILHPAARYLAARVGDALAGCFLLIDTDDLEVEMHAAILPAYVAHSRTLGRACLAHIFRDPRVQRVSAPVMADLPTARNYGLKLGFRIEGTRRNACQKRGRLIDVHALAITRQDWERQQ